MGEPRQIDPKLRYGQAGAGWGNLLLAEGELSRDEEFTFDGDASGQRYWVTRVIDDPLKSGKKVHYYEWVPRWKHPSLAPRPSP